MSDRYEFSNDVITIIPSVERQTGTVSNVTVMDTGRFLALDTVAPEDTAEAPVVSPLYLQCMQACHEILETVGSVTGKQFTTNSFTLCALKWSDRHRLQYD